MNGDRADQDKTFSNNNNNQFTIESIWAQKFHFDKNIVKYNNNKKKLIIITFD